MSCTRRRYYDLQARLRCLLCDSRGSFVVLLLYILGDTIKLHITMSVTLIEFLVS